MRVLFVIILFLHLVIHFIGFANAMEWLEIVPSSQIISKPQGSLWLLVSILLVATIILFILEKPGWNLLAIPVILISQVLIIFNWEEAKYGSIINLIILLVIIFSVAGWKFENTYKKDKVKAILSNFYSPGITSAKDIAHLPESVQRYIKYTGFIGKPKIENVQIKSSGLMRERDQKWFRFKSEQLNTIQKPARYFFIKAIFKGIPTRGYHKYEGKAARMLIKPLSLFNIIDIRSDELLISEMVTYLNDICLFAPGALISEKFSWENMDALGAKVSYSHSGKTVSAILEFNENAQLINFFSNDRYSVDRMKKFLFSAPVGGYKSYSGYHLPGYGEAIWHYPKEDFVYGKFELKQVKYNITNNN